MQNKDLSHSLKRFPYWLRQSIRVDGEVLQTKSLLNDLHINTVCQAAHCPNLYECFSRRKCTFLILGNTCTRSCGFCSVGKDRGSLEPPDKSEPFRIKEVVKRLGLQKVVITSVTRDDLDNGGARHFAECIRSLRELGQDLRIEVLVPDFLGNPFSIESVVCAGIDVFGHNLETVPRLYGKVRPGANYGRSLDVLRYAKQLNSALVTKSALMVGLGETKREVYSVMHDLKASGCDIITVGQYLKPEPGCLEVEEFLHPEEFEQLYRYARGLGFREVSCSPFSRSSYI